MNMQQLSINDCLAVSGCGDKGLSKSEIRALQLLGRITWWALNTTVDASLMVIDAGAAATASVMQEINQLDEPLPTIAPRLGHGRDLGFH